MTSLILMGITAAVTWALTNAYWGRSKSNGDHRSLDCILQGDAASSHEGAYTN